MMVDEMVVVLIVAAHVVDAHEGNHFFPQSLVDEGPAWQNHYEHLLYNICVYV